MREAIQLYERLGAIVSGCVNVCRCRRMHSVVNSLQQGLPGVRALDALGAQTTLRIAHVRRCMRRLHGTNEAQTTSTSDVFWGL